MKNIINVAQCLRERANRAWSRFEDVVSWCRNDGRRSTPSIPSSSTLKSESNFTVFTTPLSLLRAQRVVQQPAFSVVRGGEGLEAPSLAADFRPWYFGEGGRVTLPLPISWPNPVRGKGGGTLPRGPFAVRAQPGSPTPLHPPV